MTSVEGPSPATGRPAAASSDRLHALDGLRGIFALMVVALHMTIAHPFLNAAPLRNAGIAVDYFFVLSGFVIALSWGHRLNTPADLGRFAILRLGRLWPLHLATMLALLALMGVKLAAARTGLYAGGEPLPAAAEFAPVVLREALFLNVGLDAPEMRLNFPAWSIAAEFWTYLLFAGIAVLSAAAGGALRAALVIGATAAAGAVVLGLVDPGFGAAHGHGLFRAIFFFGIGTIVHALWRQMQASGWRAGPWAEGAVVLMVVAAFAIEHRIAEPRLMTAIVFAVSILVLASGQGPVTRALSSAPLRTLGARSYSIYMIHAVIFAYLGVTLRALDRALPVDLFAPGWVGSEHYDMLLSPGGPWANLLVAIGILALTVWLSGITLRWIERPGQSLFRRIATRSPRHAGPAPSGPQS